jgi:hypothetical protein
MANGVVEMTISGGGYGGDFVRLPNGDLALSIDTESSSPATQERLARYVLTNKRIVDTFGNPVARGDHPAYQNFGAGIGAYVGAQASPAVESDIQADISDQINGDAYITQNPAPTISFSLDDQTQEILSVNVTVQPTSGSAVTTNSIPLRQGV